MQTADEFLLEARLAAYGGVHPFDDDGNPLPLPWGDMPEPDEDVMEYHPDCPNEAVAWWQLVRRKGRISGRGVLCIKKSFVEDCLSGNIKSIENPRQWLWNKLIGLFIADVAVR